MSGFTSTRTTAALFSNSSLGLSILPRVTIRMSHVALGSHGRNSLGGLTTGNRRPSGVRAARWAVQVYSTSRDKRSCCHTYIPGTTVYSSIDAAAATCDHAYGSQVRSSLWSFIRLLRHCRIPNDISTAEKGIRSRNPVDNFSAGSEKQDRTTYWIRLDVSVGKGAFY